VSTTLVDNEEEGLKSSAAPQPWRERTPNRATVVEKPRWEGWSV